MRQPSEPADSDWRHGLTASGSVLLPFDINLGAFNLFGHRQSRGVGTQQVNNALSDSFGRVLTALPRQQAELAVRFVF